VTAPLDVIVLEDEWAARNLLTQLLEQSGRARVVAAVPSPALALAALEHAPSPVDAIFVDVTLVGEAEPERAGLDFIAELARRGASARVVLATAAREHALTAFELGAVDYVTKPFSAARVAATLERLAARAGPVAPPRPDAPLRIAARAGRGVVFLERHEAWAFEAEGRLTFVHAPRGRLDVDLSLTSLEEMLGAEFVRVHRGWLVAVDAVRGFERDGSELTLEVGPKGLVVPVARDRAARVRELLLERSVGLRRE
jgi:DNA-binding LytR/AlgR family response regulator